MTAKEKKLERLIEIRKTIYKLRRQIGNLFGPRCMDNMLFVVSDLVGQAQTDVHFEKAYRKKRK